MDILVEQLDERLRVWQPKTVQQVRQLISELIEMADQETLGLLRSRSLEQEVLDTIDEN